jgi:hypothetical protein
VAVPFCLTMSAVEAEESQPVGAQHGRRRAGESPSTAPTSNKTGWGASEGKSDSAASATGCVLERLCKQTSPINEKNTAVAELETVCLPRQTTMGRIVFKSQKL